MGQEVNFQVSRRAVLRWTVAGASVAGIGLSVGAGPAEAADAPEPSLTSAGQVPVLIPGAGANQDVEAPVDSGVTVAGGAQGWPRAWPPPLRHVRTF